MRARRDSGFTLLELIIVVAIIGICASGVMMFMRGGKTDASSSRGEGHGSSSYRTPIDEAEEFASRVLVVRDADVKCTAGRLDGSRVPCSVTKSDGTIVRILCASNSGCRFEEGEGRR